MNLPPEYHMRSDDDSPALAALLEMLALERLPRTGWLQAGLPQAESIAAHSHGVATLALTLGTQVEPPLDVDRVVTLCVAHDLPEARLGDLPRTAADLLPPGAKRSAEEAAGDALLEPFGPQSRARLEEYLIGETREARFARVCDRLQLALRLLAYARAGARGLGRFRRGVEGLDCSEFDVAREMRDEVVAAIVATGAFE
ncbi:hypothetical protein Pla163_34160 [Planctomycetes bacterium Pla163]|uniref:5'-deoxynucleotidase n=1 Tax=Rohdeia mirabilis TaxID=2528008 RepID=A0A518D460_9BACT|nr:hypothetical protein Pla163_34160 [Planctomycetes bacterium Pla163]